MEKRAHVSLNWLNVNWLSCVQSTDMPDSIRRSVLGALKCIWRTLNEHIYTLLQIFICTYVWVCVWMRVFLCVCVCVGIRFPFGWVLVPQYYTISNRIKSLKVSITQRVLQLPSEWISNRAQRESLQNWKKNTHTNYTNNNNNNSHN